jgi:hypothetical protein
MMMLVLRRNDDHLNRRMTTVLLNAKEHCRQPLSKDAVAAQFAPCRHRRNSNRREAGIAVGLLRPRFSTLHQVHHDAVTEL